MADGPPNIREQAETVSPPAPRCKHGMRPAFCGVCNPPPPTPMRAPRPGSGGGRRAAAAVTPKDLGYAVVKTIRNHDSFGSLGPTTRFVHVDGHPFLWAVEEILARAPGLKTLQVIPTQMRHMHPDTHLRILKERGVTVRDGHHRPALAWATDGARSRNVDYEPQRRFLAELGGPQKALFDELLAFGFPCALLARRYYCLGGEGFVARHELATEYGYNPRSDAPMSMQTGGMFHYLDPDFEVTEQSRTFVRSMSRQVERLRRCVQKDQWRQRVAERAGIPRLPDGIPLSRLAVMEALVKARDDGRLGAVGADGRHGRDPRMILARFGLDDPAIGPYRTLEDVGAAFGITRERVRQVEVSILEALGIDEASLAVGELEPQAEPTP